ncbi:MAG: hypothetical protein QXI49_07235 [Candidatus Methanomethylicaceae archaeon]
MIILKREKTPIELVIYGIYIYIRSRSLRLASEILEPLIERSYEFIRNWYHKFNKISNVINPRIKSKIALVDETFFEIKNKEAILWIAFEPYRRIFIDFQITIGKESLNSIQAWKIL